MQTTIEMADDIPMRADELSKALQEFHRALIRSEIGDNLALENPYTMLFALIGDPRFAWMRGLSDLITRIDESAAEGALGEPGVFDGFVAESRALLGQGEHGGDAGPHAALRLRHVMALHKEPEVGLATGRLRKVLARQAVELA